MPGPERFDQVGLCTESERWRPKATVRRVRGGAWSTGLVITAFGVFALTFMMTMYALEHRGPGFVLAFAAGCMLSSAYGFLSGAWPFGIVELVWAAIAAGRWKAAARADPRR